MRSEDSRERVLSKIPSKQQRVCVLLNNNRAGVTKMAQPINVLATGPDDLKPTQWKENDSYTVSLDLHTH